jgi:transcriptional regulator with XRE-family HTH domain
MKPDLLRAQRMQHGWSQAKLAQQLGVDARTVRRWELGEAVPVPYYRKQLLRLFDKTAEELGLCSDSDENESVEEAPTSITQPLEPDVPDDVEESPSEMQTNPSYWQHAYEIPPLMDNIDRHGLPILGAQYNKSRLLRLMFFLSVITVLISFAFFQVMDQAFIPVQKSISPTQLAVPATPTATTQPTPHIATIPTVIPTPTPIPRPIVHKIIAIDDSVEGTGTNQFNYAGGWVHCTGGCNGCCYDGTWSWDNTAGDYMTVSFTGTQIKFYVVVGPYGGIGAISVDGRSETMVNCYSTEAIGKQLMWTSPMLPTGAHTFKLRVTGTKGDPSSNDSEVGIDRVDILS